MCCVAIMSPEKAPGQWEPH